jgi:uroporphyrin-III C-methyltransferase
VTKGKVFLVGAGPGDPDLLTLKAARLLRTADVVLHDDLVGDHILRMIPSHVQLHNVGKRCGVKKITQDEINFLMVSLALSGLQVVRLKGGDPLIFGRVAEEMEALEKAKIDFEIVPGITAALGAAATAQIPLSRRGSSPAIIFVTANRAADADPIDWRALIKSQATLAIYMPGHAYGPLASNLRSAGLSKDTPCAIISRATTSEQQVHVTNLADLNLAPRLPAPSLLVVGDVLRHASRHFHELASWDAGIRARSLPFTQAERDRSNPVAATNEEPRV